MPVRSSSSSVFRWPDARQVHAAVVEWAAAVAAERPEIRCVGYIGSYARGDWGVGSDVDLIVILGESERPPLERAADFDVTHLPVPADLLVYTEAEWSALGERSARLHEVGRAEGIWVYP